MFQDEQKKIGKIFDSFKSFELGKDKPAQLFTQIESALAQVNTLKRQKETFPIHWRV